MSQLKAQITKLTVQALMATAVTLTACGGFIIGRLDGPTFVALAMLAFIWAFRQPSGNGQ